MYNQKAKRCTFPLIWLLYQHKQSTNQLPSGQEYQHARSMNKIFSMRISHKQAIRYHACPKQKSTFCTLTKRRSFPQTVNEVHPAFNNVFVNSQFTHMKYHEQSNGHEYTKQKKN